MKTLQSQTEGSRLTRIAREPDRHYVRVQVDAPGVDYESPISDFLDATSRVDPSTPMYRIDSDKAIDTGSSKVVLLSCSEADHQLMLAQNDKTARSRENAVSSTSNGNEFETIERGSAQSL